MKKLIFLFFLISKIQLFSQIEEKLPNDVLTTSDTLPEYIGGLKEYYNFLGKNIRFPIAALEKGMEGTIYVTFIVNTDGSFDNVVIKGSKITARHFDKDKKQYIKSKIENDTTFNEEALRFVKSMPKWKPGVNQGKIVRVAYTLPLKFKLE
jgi:periplasmic protein TonB